MDAVVGGNYQNPDIASHQMNSDLHAVLWLSKTRTSVRRIVSDRLTCMHVQRAQVAAAHAAFAVPPSAGQPSHAKIGRIIENTWIPAKCIPSCKILAQPQRGAVSYD